MSRVCTLLSLALVAFLSSPVSAQCLSPSDLTCASDCATGNITLAWTNQDTYSDLELLFLDSQGAIAYTETLPGSASSATVTATLPSDRYAVQLSGACGGQVSTPTACTLFHAPYDDSGDVDIIWMAEGPGGLNDSLPAIKATLDLWGLPALVIDDLENYPCLSTIDSSLVLWACLGTFPDNHALTIAEGQKLADFAIAGAAIYVEGSDVWGMDPATAFADYDGVENGTATNGDNSLTALAPIPFNCTIPIDEVQPYQQDQLGNNDSTDRLLPAPEGAFGIPFVIWKNEPDGAGETDYNVTIYTDNKDIFGGIICQSWEIGGYGGDPETLVLLYRQSLRTFFFVDLFFHLGDCNNDGTVNIADAITLLTALFDPAPANFACERACDTNEDEQIDIADGVTLLNGLFGGQVVFDSFCGGTSCVSDLSCNNPFCP